MRTPMVLVLALLALAGCGGESPAKPERAATPSSSASPVVRFKAPAKLHGLPRNVSAKWLKVPKSTANYLEGQVLRPTSTVAAAYLDPGDLSEQITVSAAAGRVATPDIALRLMTQSEVNDLEDVAPVDIGVPGGVALCGVSKRDKPAVHTMCNWAAPGSVGDVDIWSLQDRRAWLADIRDSIES